MGAYAELRDHDWLAAHMTLKALDCATVARRCTFEQSHKVSRQMISHLKIGKLKTCTPELAEAICRVVEVPTGALFVMRDVRNQSSQNTQRGAA